METLSFKSEDELVLLGKLVNSEGDDLKSVDMQAGKSRAVTDDNGIWFTLYLVVSLE
ncbi:hypothetical protein [Parendozoicomonas sp. Alg238-R29]|uniref:hypothetical protein n=1 Tax=Parendozoicomonas sp. Alg238-R29 TaxID=2993446 RepID=UPI00248E9E62|nr:hypothetical protein [Parendozoicomonas sp. Alg238-R29]